MGINRTRALCLAFVLASVGVLAQAPTLTEVQQRDVLITQLNERIAALQTEVMRLQLILDKQQRTPPARDGYAWDWTFDEHGQPKGYVKSPPVTEKATP